jgi:membrane-bound lytic murein transglycosylase MltF
MWTGGVKRIWRRGRGIMACAMLALLTGVAAPGQGAMAQAPRAAAPVTGTWTGDFAGMLQRRVIRIIVPYSKTLFFVDRGRQMGLVAEFGQAFEAWVNKRHAKGHLRPHVVFVPMPREAMLPALQAGRGDVVAANLTITPERLEQVDFARPWLTDAKEVVVTGPASPALASLDDLAGRTITVRLSSSYAAHLKALSARLVDAGKAAITLRPADEDLEDEDLLEMVSAGLLPLAVVDEHKAESWVGIYPGLTLRRDLVLHAGGEIAWAIRKGSPLLKAELDAFFAEHRAGTSFGNTLRQRYFGGTRAVRAAASDGERVRFNDLLDNFRTHGGARDFDPLMLAAQGYQESQLDQRRRSHRGAVGVMQLLPSTAAAKPVSIPDVASSADTNIKAGAIYMRHLMDAYVKDPALDMRNRLLMTLAAYNAGPGNLRKFRRVAAQKGFDPNIWFNNVEHGAAATVGRETVQYVSNIYKYYLTYRLLTELETPVTAAAGKRSCPDGGTTC